MASVSVVARKSSAQRHTAMARKNIFVVASNSTNHAWRCVNMERIAGKRLTPMARSQIYDSDPMPESEQELVDMSTLYWLEARKICIVEM